MGFGLFVPEFRSVFSMSTSTVGIVSSLGFSGFFIGLLMAQMLLTRRGPELPVLTGLVAAAVGMGIVASAPNVPVLAFGVFLATSSAGFAWTPFNNAVHRKVRDEGRAVALSAISTGTGVGIAGAGFAALAMVLGGLSWQYCWTSFAVAAALALLGNRAALRSVENQSESGPRQGWRNLARLAAIPLFVIGFAYGTTSAIYISFAADHLVEAGGVPGIPVAATPALVYICYGLFGLAGLASAQIKAMTGLPMLLRLLMLAGAVSVALVAIAPGRWSGLVVSAGLQGVHVMMTSAVLAFWSERLFPTLPSLSFTAALLATAAGSVLGPALAGMASDALGAEAMFFGAAALPAVTALLLRDRHARERPLPTDG
ncbi:Arabinose efflux permease [Jannaschia seosinensis]|uniref:Arabinose efflux permease n=1 Tax=Jannaschia seosinensis TaxID=313367 RepID=A0A0M7BAP1_9RHOB|nr:MFS transporter [Jannaschia seosinensis]CUH39857.1 Arabinose efflux permease [Jannaschia seosinensis]